MRGKKVSGIILALLLTGMVTSASNANTQPLETQPRTWIVDDDGPADLSSIQEAINAASPGDTIYVKAGTYREPQVTINKPLQLIGENKNTTIVDGGGTWVCLYVQNTQNVTISGFTIQNGFGIYSWGSQNVTINENIIFDNEQGIVIGESTYITVSKNIVTQNGGMPILLDGSNNSKIYENIFTLNNGASIWLSHSSNNSIYGNKIKSNGRGIRLDWSSNNSIYGNDITNNGVGIYYWASSNNSIYGNKIEDNVSGIVLKGYSGNLSSSNTFYRNNITNNEIGVNVEDSSNNIFYHNNFKDNTQQVIIETSGYSNSWDNGYGGNYWSDYGERYPDAEELDGSGIWDTPYVIDENNQDNYPLMEAWTPSPPLPRTIDELKTEIEKCWSEGEIDNQGIVKSLLAKLDAAERLVNIGRVNEAKTVLKCFITQVQKLSGICITKEAADILVSVAMSFLVSGLNCEAALLEEQDEEMLVVRVFAPIVEGENESLPIEGAQVYIWPDASKDPDMSKEAGREFYLDGVTDENGVVVFNLSRSLYYFNASIYHIHASAVHYATPVCLVNITETLEVSVYLGEPPKQMRLLPFRGQAQYILCNPYFVLVLIATAAMSTAIVAWSLKQRKAHIHKSHKAW